VTYLEKTAELLAANAMKDAFIDLNNEQHETRITRLTAEKDAIVAGLTTAHKAEVEALTAAHQAQVAELTTTHQVQVAQLTQLTQEQSNPKYILQQAKHLAILDKLRMLTQNYQIQLIKEAQTTFKVTLDSQNPDLSLLVATDTETLKKNLKYKLQAIGELNEILSEDKPASEKTERFYQKLVEVNFSEKNHDSDLKTYCYRALKLLALILTGILPGVIYYAYDNSNLFWTSDKRFSQKSQEILQPVTPPVSR
jgi:hypothetical protein